MHKRPLARPPWFVHPFMSFVPTAVGSSLFAVYASQVFRLSRFFQELGANTPRSQQFKSNWTLTSMWTGLAVGLGIGFFTIAVESYICRKTKQFQAEVLVMPAAQRFGWSIAWRQLLHALPLILTQLVLAGLVWLEVLSFGAILASLAPLGLGYFEYRKVYEAAKSRVRNHPTTAGGLD